MPIYHAVAGVLCTLVGAYYLALRNDLVNGLLMLGLGFMMLGGSDSSLVPTGIALTLFVSAILLRVWEKYGKRPEGTP
jgi:hypothetical protein